MSHQTNVLFQSQSLMIRPLNARIGMHQSLNQAKESTNNMIIGVTLANYT
jgi:hypothetical protein